MRGRAGRLAGLARPGLGRRARGAIGAHRATTSARSRSLHERGVLYECFCSRADVRRAASAPHGPDGPLYSGPLPRPDRERARRPPLARPSAVAARAHAGHGRVPRRPRRPAARDARGHERRHRPAAQRRRRRLPARGRRRRCGPGRHARRARGRSARLDGASAPALPSCSSWRPSRATRTSRCCSAPTASGSRSATAPSGSRSCARGAPTRARSSAGSRTAPGCSSVPSPVPPATSSSASTRPRCAREPARVDPGELRW